MKMNLVVTTTHKDTIILNFSQIATMVKEEPKLPISFIDKW